MAEHPVFLLTWRDLVFPPPSSWLPPFLSLPTPRWEVFLSPPPLCLSLALGWAAEAEAPCSAGLLGGGPLHAKTAPFFELLALSYLAFSFGLATLRPFCFVGAACACKCWVGLCCTKHPTLLVCSSCRYWDCFHLGLPLVASLDFGSHQCHLLLRLPHPAFFFSPPWRFSPSETPPFLPLGSDFPVFLSALRLSPSWALLLLAPAGRNVGGTGGTTRVGGILHAWQVTPEGDLELVPLEGESGVRPNVRVGEDEGSSKAPSTRSVQVVHPPFNLGCIHLQLAFQGEDNIFPFRPGRHLSDGGTNGALAELIAAPSATETIRGESPGASSPSCPTPKALVHGNPCEMVNELRWLAGSL